MAAGQPASPPQGPSLPAGLGQSAAPSGPALPKGLGGEQPRTKPGGDPLPPPRPALADVAGFWEARGGVRTQADPHQRQASIGETRLQLRLDRHGDRAAFRLVTDLLYDPVEAKYAIDLEDGEGFLDLREANVQFEPAQHADLKAGRQILTWGTGDLIFINDLFPKDWRSFFIGRAIEYLKAPSDAVKASLFGRPANVDLVYTPRFDPDRYLDGRRLSFFNPQAGERTGRGDVLEVDKPNDWLKDDEIAGRLYRHVGSYELALYGYSGYWKSPSGFDPVSAKATFPRLSVYGASLRGPLWKGLWNVEGGFYDSRDDTRGTDPNVRNSEYRLLAGYEQELSRDFTLGLQYYLERMKDHDKHHDSLPPDSPERSENRHVVTLRLTRRLMQQDLTLSFFGYYSPFDDDGYLRPKVHYRLDDAWFVELGANLFFGDKETFFGQFNNNTNVYAAVRYSFQALEAASGNAF